MVCLRTRITPIINNSVDDLLELKQVEDLIKKHNKKLAKIREQADKLADCIRNLEALKPEPQYKREKGLLVKDKVDHWKLPNRPFSTKEMTEAEHAKCIQECCKEADSIKFT